MLLAISVRSDVLLGEANVRASLCTLRALYRSLSRGCWDRSSVEVYLADWVQGLTESNTLMAN